MRDTINDVSCLQTSFPHSSVSDADLKIPTLGSTDNVGNSVNLVSGITFPTLSVYPRLGVSRSASKTDDRFYSRLSLSQLRLSRITAYLEEKI